MAKLSQRKVKAAIEGSGGIITDIAGKCGVSRRAIYKFLEKHPDLRENITEEEEQILDEGVGKLHDAVKSGEPWAVMFLLSTKGKGRGFTKRQEVTGADGEAILMKMLHGLDEISDEQLAKLLRES